MQCILKKLCLFSSASKNKSFATWKNGFLQDLLGLAPALKVVACDLWDWWRKIKFFWNALRMSIVLWFFLKKYFGIVTQKKAEFIVDFLPSVRRVTVRMENYILPCVKYNVYGTSISNIYVLKEMIQFAFLIVTLRMLKNIWWEID